MSRSKRRSPTRDNSPPPLSAIPTAPASDAPSRRELWLVATLLVLGIGMRVAFPSRMAIEHFDEGVYASNIWFGAEADYHYPMQRLYAPPLLPSLIEWSLIFDRMGEPASHKINSFVPLVPSLFAGCLTLLVIWRMTREWFGPEAGLATLAIASLSDFHALYSRTALTEALMLLLFVAAVWMLQRAFSRGSYASLGLAGLLTGLCWWTKYNGWLPLAVGFGGLTIGFVVDARCRNQFVKLTFFWLGTVAIAFAVWSPYLRDLQSMGGYGPISVNHSKYLVGFVGWTGSLSQQYANLCHFDGWATCVSVGSAMVLVGFSSSSLQRPSMKLLTLGTAFSAASVWLGAAFLMFLLAIWIIGTEIYRRWSSVEADTSRAGLAWYLLAAWIGGLFIATPLYHPYPRLTLPWLCAVWMGSGLAVSRLVEILSEQNERKRLTKPWRAILIIGTVALLIGLPRLADRGMPALQARTGWLPVSQQIVAEVGKRAEATRGNRDEAIVIVYGEPGLFYQLNVDGTQVFGPAADLSFVTRPPQDPTIPIFLVTGPHAERTTGFWEDLGRHESQLEAIGTYEYLPSDLVLLNQHDVRSLSRKDWATRTERVTLYQVAYPQQER